MIGTLPDAIGHVTRQSDICLILDLGKVCVFLIKVLREKLGFLGHPASAV